MSFLARYTVSYVPIDLDAEHIEATFGRDGLALNSDDEFDEEVAEVGLVCQSSPSVATAVTDILG